MCLDEGLESVAIAVTDCVNIVIALRFLFIQTVQYVFWSNPKVTISSVASNVGIVRRGANADSAGSATKGITQSLCEVLADVCRVRFIVLGIGTEDFVVDHNVITRPR